jgi:hypothetical protein
MPKINQSPARKLYGSAYTMLYQYVRYIKRAWARGLRLPRVRYAILI